jgi:hypothetical protein
MIFVQPHTSTSVYLLHAESMQISRDAEELKVSIKIARGLYVIYTEVIVPQTYDMRVVFNEQIKYLDKLAPTY